MSPNPQDSKNTPDSTKTQDSVKVKDTIKTQQSTTTSDPTTTSVPTSTPDSTTDQIINTPPLDRISGKIENWKKKLLDLTRRNPQLNFSPVAKNRIEFVFPDITSLFDTLVINGKGISLPPVFSVKSDDQPRKKRTKKTSKNKSDKSIDGDVEDTQPEPAKTANGQNNTAPAAIIDNVATEDAEETKVDVTLHQQAILEKQKKLKKYEAITNQYDELLKRNLEKFQEKAESDIEELGINSGYITFGLVKWYEKDRKGEFLYSPLLLLPIELKRKNLLSDFKISITDDDVIVNPTLLKKLMDDYKIQVPDFPDEFELETFNTYIPKIKEILKINPEFDIEARSFLGIFKFNKLALYNDLVEHSDTVKKHEIISAIATGAGSFRGNVNIHSDIDIESIPAIQNFTILDADASQLKAIHAAKNGASMIIQGPPGTGKSQCISNIIAECMAAGKKVLFVSQKKAALDVVKKRLDDNSLGFFCLELHSEKAKKADVLQQIRTSRDLSLNGSAKFDKIYDEFDQIKVRLNEYLASVHDSSILKSEQTFYDLLSSIGSQMKEVSRIWRLRNAIELNKQDMDQIEQNLKLLQNEINALQNFRTSVWNKLIITENKYPEKDTLEDLLHEYDDSLKFALEFPSLNSFSAPKKTEDMNQWQYHIEVLKYAQITFDLFERWNKIFLIEQKLKPLIPLNIFDPLTSQFKALQQLTQKFSQQSIQQMMRDLENIITELQNFANSYLTVALKSDQDVTLILNLINNYDIKLLLEDLAALIDTFKTKFSSFSRFFNSEYYKTDKKVKSYFKSKKIKTLDGLTEADAIKKMLTNKSLENLPDCESTLKELNNSWQEFTAHSKDFQSLYEMKPIENAIKIKEWTTKQTELQPWLKNLDFYSSWRTISTVKNALKKWQLDSIFDESAKNELINKNLWLEFQNQYMIQVAQTILQRHPNLNTFNSINHENDIQKFGELDAKRLQMNKMRVFSSILGQRPKFTDFVSDQQSSEIGFLEHELSKTRNIKPLRKIFSKSKNYIVKLMPCFMMSPLSVATNLPIEDYDQFFDVVIFDEASQVCPEDAIGAILRGKQLIVAGDEQQMPPTSFFNSTAFLEDDTEDIEDLESILKECQGIGFKNVPLTWHYRSRKEGLIAFSNRHFYEDKLETFPEPWNNKVKNAKSEINEAKNTVIPPKVTPPAKAELAQDVKTTMPPDQIQATETAKNTNGTDEKETEEEPEDSEAAKIAEAAQAAKDMENVQLLPAIEFHYIQGALFENQMNKAEANQIADVIIQSVQEYPTMSVGVVAFSLKQEGAIRKALRARIKENPALETLIKKNKKEPLFIKNLESVQGDERDFMFFSIGYGPNSTGKILANFGPINKEGGYRRLNVAITRAKYHIKIFCSFIPGNIESTRSSAVGYQKTIKYLEFANSGRLDPPQNTKPTLFNIENEFAEQLAQELRNLGYKVDTQVGCSNFRIDVAIVDPKNPAHYLVGIECDGGSYQATKSARDRVKGRHDVLKRLGWNLIHVWSPEWFKSPKDTLKRIQTEIEKFQIDPNPQQPTPISSELPEIEIIQKEPPAKVTATQQKTPEYREKFFELKGVCEYIRYASKPKYQKEALYESRTVREKIIQEIIATEGPIHRDLLEKHIRVVFSLNSINVRARELLDSLYEKLNRDGDFFLPGKQWDEKVRIFKDVKEDPRNFDQIYDKELGKCMAIIAEFAQTWIMNALLLDRTVKIILGVVYSVLWLTVMTLAWKGKNTPAAVLFCVVAWLSGYLSSWVVDSAKNSLGEELAHTLFVRSTIIAVVAVATGLTIGLFASKWFKSGFRWVLSAFGMSGTLLQLGLTSMFGYEEGTFIASCIGFIWIAATIIFDGSRLPRQIGAGKWMQATAKIFLDLVTVLMKVFKLLVRVEKKKTKKTKSKVK